MLYELYLNNKFKAGIICHKPDVIKKRFRNLTTRTREGKGKMGREENFSRSLFGENRKSKLQLHTVLKLMTVKKNKNSVCGEGGPSFIQVKS